MHIESLRARLQSARRRAALIFACEVAVTLCALWIAYRFVRSDDTNDRMIGVALIEAIGEDGYLSESIDEIQASLRPDVEAAIDEIEAVLHRIQRFDPLGVAARNGIMLISHYQHLEEFEGMPFGRELVLRGARERVAPIMMTALTAGLALVPLVIAGSIPGHEIEHPMAIVILGGLVTSTLVNLFIVPALYLVYGNRNLPSQPDAGQALSAA